MRDITLRGVHFPNVLSIGETLERMQTLLERRIPFVRIRYGDGEAKTMLHLVGEGATTSGEHHCFRDLGKALLLAFDEMRAADGVLLGACPYPENSYPELDAMIDHMGKHPTAGTPVWASGDAWYTTEGEVKGEVADVVALLETIRHDTRVKVLACNPTVAEARHCLGAHHLWLPQRDAWLAREGVLRAAGSLAEQGAVFVWCGGIACKPWMWDLFKEFPLSTHIDMGHLFDGVFGHRNRGWLTYPDGHHLRYLRDVLIPHVRRFVP